MAKTLFTRIIEGDLPSHKLYEDDRTFVFLDIYPILPGHTLVIPKNPVEFVWDLPDEDYEAVMRTAKRTALQLRTVMGSRYVAERIIGVDVPHAHVQLIPFDDAADLRPPERSTQGEAADLAELARRLALPV